MADVIFVAVVVAFFGLAVAYVRACERIVDRDRGGADGDAGRDTGRAAGLGRAGAAR